MPAVSNIVTSALTDVGFTVTCTTNAAKGTAYMVVIAQGEAAPSGTQIKAGNNYLDNPALASQSMVISSTTISFLAVTNLSTLTKYDVYIVQDISSIVPDLPLLALWESNMLTHGAIWGDWLVANPEGAGALNNTYYDGQRVFFQIADYTSDNATWYPYAAAAEVVRRDNYYLTILQGPYKASGHQRFMHGLYQDAVRTGDAISIAGIPLLRDEPSQSNPDTSGSAAGWWASGFSREIAYGLSGQVFAERYGHARNETRMATFVAMCLAHVNEWVTEVYIDPTNVLKPWMCGLTAEALIDYYQWEVDQGNSPDETIPNALKSLADFLMVATVQDGVNAGKLMWVADLGGSGGAWDDTGGVGYGAFRYEDANAANPAPDLTLLVAPLFAWVFNHFGIESYITFGDLVWEGGVGLGAPFSAGKQFNQNYRWSFDYVTWRTEGYA